MFDGDVCVCLQVKCDQYWPNRGTETYGLIQVTLLDTVELATYCVRTFALYKVCGCFRDRSPKTEIFHLCCERFTFQFRTAPVRSGRCGSSSSRRGRITASRNIPRHSWPSCAGSNHATRQTLDQWWCIAGLKRSLSLFLHYCFIYIYIISNTMKMIMKLQQ